MDYKPQRHDKKSTVSDLVYKYLKKVSYSTALRQQRNNVSNKFRKANGRRRSLHPTRKYTNARDHDARNYIRDALSFAFNAGYLMPTDGTRRILRLSPSLKLHSGSI